MGKVLIEKLLYLKYIQKTFTDLKQLLYKFKVLYSFLSFFLIISVLRSKKKVPQTLSLVYHLQKGNTSDH